MSVQTFYPKVESSIEPSVQRHLQMIYKALNNHAQAFEYVKANGTTTSTSSSSTSTTTATTTTASTVVSSSLPGLGTRNNQTGNTSYTTQTADNGALVIFNDASPVAVTLNATVSTPWMAFITNFGAGVVTLTPSSGTINAGASLSMAQHETSIVVFDGSNWWTSDLLILAQTIASVSHEWLNSYDASTGLFTQTQPAFTDISGTAAPSQLPAATTSSLGAVEPDGTTISVSGGVISATGSFSTVSATTVNATTGNITDINSSGTSALATVTASTVSSGSVADTGLSTAGYVTNTAAGVLGTVAQIPASGITTALASPPAIGGSSPAAGTFTALAGNTSVYSPVGNLTTVNATTVSASGKVQAGVFAGTGSATITAGSTTVTGTSPSLAVYGSGASGEIDFTVGTSPSASGVIATITFPTTYPSAPKAIIVGNGNALPSGSGFSWTTTTTELVISCNAVLTGGNFYKMEYILMA